MGTQIIDRMRCVLRSRPRPAARSWRLEPVGHNDRRPQGRQARHRRGTPCGRWTLAGALAGAIAALLHTGAGSIAAESEQAPLEIERQRNESRIETLDRKREQKPPDATVRTPPPAPYDPAPPPAGPSPDARRQDLERRALEGRQRTINRDLDRLGGRTNPSSSGLLDRLRRN